MQVCKSIEAERQELGVAEFNDHEQGPGAEQERGVLLLCKRQGRERRGVHRGAAPGQRSRPRQAPGLLAGEVVVEIVGVFGKSMIFCFV